MKHAQQDNLWKKVNGIPFSARRTRDITQNPAKPNIIYAGTTEGLWRTIDGGDSWMLITSKRIVRQLYCNQSYQSKSSRSGYRRCRNNDQRRWRENFGISNEGFINRQVMALVADPREPHRVYAGVVYDGLMAVSI